MKMQQNFCGLIYLVIYGTLFNIFVLSSTVADSSTIRPNIVIFIADDLGYGDLGSFGNQTIPTPNIDKLADQGVRFTHHLAAASLCTPSRAALLTGRYPIRYGLASDWVNRVFLFVAAKGGLPTTEITFPKLLQQSNYSTALIGKWHLGAFCSSQNDLCHHPLQHGFDYFYGIPLTNLKDFGSDGSSVVLSNFPYFHHVLSTIMCLGLSFSSMLYKYKGFTKISIFIVVVSVLIPGLLFLLQRSITRLNSVLMRNENVIEQPVDMSRLNQRLIKEAKTFITTRTEQQQPFLLVVAFSKVHTSHFPSKKFFGKSKHGKFGDCVMELDWSVGQITSTLSERGMEENTFIYFTSDNGGHLEEVDYEGNYEGGYNGIFRGGKGQGAVEGGIRIPAIVQWKDTIDANQEIDCPTSHMDLLPTILNIANISPPNDRIFDGHNLLPLMRSANRITTLPRQFIFHYCGAYLAGVRYIEDIHHIWKYYYFTPNYKYPSEHKCQFMCQCFGSNVIKHDPPLLFNIANDPQESLPITNNQLNRSKYTEIVTKIEEAVQQHKQSIGKNVESQFTFSNTIWRPHLQPCCNFPFCSCVESDRNENSIEKSEFSVLGH